MAYRAGLVALIGKPNVGKSTLLNLAVGQKVSIVSDKAQTTRRRILGIVTREAWQIAFVDTPGVHEAHNRLGKLLNDASRAALGEVNSVLAVVDASKPPSDEDRAVADMVRAAGWQEPSTPPLLCMNKMDLLKAVDVQAHVEAYCTMFGTEKYMLTSLVKRQNVDLLLDMVAAELPECEALFPEDEVTDLPARVLAAEVVREKALRATRQEVPHALATVVDSYEQTPKMIRITVSIVVEKDGQKAIMIGKGGSMLRRIGTEARQELEELLDSSVYLELFVKVRTDWRQNLRMLHDLEYA